MRMFRNSTSIEYLDQRGYDTFGVTHQMKTKVAATMIDASRQIAIDVSQISSARFASLSPAKVSALGGIVSFCYVRHACGCEVSKRSCDRSPRCVGRVVQRSFLVLWGPMRALPRAEPTAWLAKRPENLRTCPTVGSKKTRHAGNPGLC